MADSGWIDDFLAALNAFDGDRVAAFFTDDGYYEHAGAGHRVEGPEAISRMISVDAPAFSADGKVTATSKVCDETGFAVEWVFSGTHDESGKTFSSRGATVGSVREGKISALVDYENPAYMADLLGSAG